MTFTHPALISSLNASLDSCQQSHRVLYSQRIFLEPNEESPLHLAGGVMGGTEGAGFTSPRQTASAERRSEYSEHHTDAECWRPAGDPWAARDRGARSVSPSEWRRVPHTCPQTPAALTFKVGSDHRLQIFRQSAAQTLMFKQRAHTQLAPLADI